MHKAFDDLLECQKSIGIGAEYACAYSSMRQPVTSVSATRGAELAIDCFVNAQSIYEVLKQGAPLTTEKDGISQEEFATLAVQASYQAGLLQNLRYNAMVDDFNNGFVCFNTIKTSAKNLEKFVKLTAEEQQPRLASLPKETQKDIMREAQFVKSCGLPDQISDDPRAFMDHLFEQTVDFYIRTIDLSNECPSDETNLLAAQAMNGLGCLFYDLGLSIQSPQHLGAAYDYFLAASNAGLPDGQMNLALLYLENEGLPEPLPLHQRQSIARDLASKAIDENPGILDHLPRQLKGEGQKFINAIAVEKGITPAKPPQRPIRKEMIFPTP